MTPEAGLLAAVCHSGTDTAPAMVLADWLEERGVGAGLLRLKRPVRWMAISWRWWEGKGHSGDHIHEYPWELSKDVFCGLVGGTWSQDFEAGYRPIRTYPAFGGAVADLVGAVCRMAGAAN